jgi:hypothetical protein
MAKGAESKEKYQGQHREYFQPSIQPKSGGGLLSLALELLGAVAISLMQRSFKAWRHGVTLWVGATLTAILFALGKFVLGLYLGSGAAGSAYWCGQLANHSSVVDLLCSANPSLWRGIYSGLREHLRHPR